MIIRRSSTTDLDAIQQLHQSAFGEAEGEAVAQLALALVADPSKVLSLVAVAENKVIGHVLFSPIQIVNYDSVSGYILAPLAVAPTAQRQGVGMKLIRFGLELLANQSVDIVMVLGDPNYYGRCGFHTEHKLAPPYSLPYPEAWQAIALQEHALQEVSGLVKCVPVLMAPEYW
ncbi:N-acetyltransferase [Corallincola luteus]|uniref:N-acetyltransferase n=2 Tax=Corallincola TaxID=1775176 RepID=A0A368NMW5_9GAMM|nr:MULTISPECIES: N-acetyltransferase [Corallincola]RCU51922.1 N-acetyltransferase [Corallincola holothuriorum]TCI05086.1 N-acetyltransferase [Corallincola luteus]